MLKISIVLVTTTAFATLLIAYPFSPHPAAQASGGVEQVAATEPAKVSRPTTLQPDSAPQGIASLPSEASGNVETGKALPARTGPVESTTVARTDPARAPDPRIPPRPSHVERPGFHSTTAPALVARPALARSEIPAGSVIARYPAYTGRTSVYIPSGGTLVRHASGARTSTRPAQRVPRYRSLALAPDQPIR